jgi:hypothetical protein
VLIGVGRGSRRGAKRRTLGYFGPCAWVPVSDAGPLNASTKALEQAMASGDLARLGEMLAASASLLLQEAAQLSRDASDIRDEVVLTDDGLARPPIDVLATLLHEAAHALASTRGIHDASRQGRYHNRRFKTIAEEVGLEVSQDPPFGWCSTSVPASTAACYREALAVIERALTRLPDRALLDDGRSAVTALVCDCGHRTLSGRRARAPVAVQCTACQRHVPRVENGRGLAPLTSPARPPGAAARERRSYPKVEASPSASLCSVAGGAARAVRSC